ncbi:response regulator receiver modulated translation initiation factor IF-2 [Nostoc punctiforme PCC 73102]|uniref:Response regulator receiver modulated translation initiation factor IF-2 n=2 Tax=Nostoc punctiforme TaxID=272131 RepID=B2J6Q7_NOSP7|nr:response regulator receiver modulated translation initiation factor IF-2 [Nostoc punctiforme PCC 73102]
MKPEVASRRIESFGQRFGETHLYLAYHAAFPLALTPDLLYRLWANFQQDINHEVLNIPWMAVADLLLSSLCDEVGHELYEMDTAVRNALLKELRENPRFGEKRINELSDFLLTYVRQQLDSYDPDIRDFAQAQKWTALAYTRPSEAARDLASVLARLKLEEKAEWVRMALLVETFAEPLAEFQPLLIYARGMANFVCGYQERATTEITGLLANQEPQLQIAGVNLPIPEQIANSFEEVRSINQFSTNLTSSQLPSTVRILAVDDVADNLILIQTVLESEGYQIDLAADGTTALSLVKESPPDLIILDVKMPEMDGYEVTRRIRNNHNLPYIPILLISAYFEASVVQGLDIGANDFIRKPIDVDELLARVRSLLRLKKMIGKSDKIEDTVESTFYNIQNNPLSNPLFISTYNNEIKDIKVKVRLYNLAKELNVDSRDIMTICKSLGIEVKSHSSTISNTDVQRIRAAFSNYLKAFAQSFPTEPITETETLKDSLISQNGLNCSLLGELLTIKNGKKLIKKPHD